MSAGKNTGIAITGVSLGPVIVWAWNASMPHVPMPGEVAAVIGSLLGTLLGTFLPQAFGDNS
jgi:hypothetical protein